MAVVLVAAAIGLGACSSAQIGPYMAVPQTSPAPLTKMLKECPNETTRTPCVLRIKGLVAGDNTGDEPGHADRHEPGHTYGHNNRVSSIPLGKDGYNRLQATDLFGHESGFYGQLRRPRFGVALAGGGSKASAFGMGVLAGLADSGFLERADYVSTVSGGGYAGLYLFRYLIEQDRKRKAGEDTGLRAKQIRAAFNDCIPAPYNNIYRTLNPSGDTPKPCPGNLALGAKNDAFPQVPVRYQQDVLSSRYDKETRTLLEGTASMTYQLASTAAWLVPHHIGNSLFDWNADTSPSRNAYRRGIFKTYGLPEDDCKRRYNDGLAFWRDWQCVNSQDPALRFNALRSIYDLPPKTNDTIPYWIINGTSGYKGAFFGPLFEPLTNWKKAGEDREDTDRNFFRDSFEMTAHGFGSGEYGYTRFVEPPLNLPNAVAAAAAFFDSQERNVKGPLRGLVAALQTALGLNWGMDIDNPLVDDDQRTVHRALPWPIYRAHRFVRGRDSVDIHISDGGMSENLGLFALLRRGVRNIVIADAAQDGQGAMADICFIRNRLLYFSANAEDRDRLLDDHGKKRLHIRFPMLQDFGDICKSQWAGNKSKTPRKDPRVYDIWNWQNPVVTGCVVIISSLKEKTNNSCPPDEDSMLLSRLYLIKPALNKNDLFRTPSKRCSVADLWTFKTAPAENPKSTAKTGCMTAKTPVELAGFLTNILKNPATNACPKFPQDGTVSLTINSDPYLYGGYRELGRAASALIKPVGDGVGPIAEIEQKAQRPVTGEKPPCLKENSGTGPKP
ncbi:MAG: hypothetical protein O3A85_04825 [Proteobacteria bacterium]|nr:hypothetical protein [Pseudomonadota bacterium]